MILYLDIGNSCIKWQTGDDKQVSRMRRTRLDQFSPLADSLADKRISQIRLALSLKHNQDALIKKITALTHCNDLVISQTQQQQSGVINGYNPWHKLGVDRWLAMVAAYHHTQGACCVIDCGTAITLDIIADNGQHLGGYIVPGLVIAKNSLASYLPNHQQRHTDGLGQNTPTAMANGIYSMISSFINQQTSHFCTQYPNAKTYITGGNGRLFSGAIKKDAIIQEDLVLYGLRL